MSEHSPARAAALIEAARTAGMVNPSAALVLVPAGDTLPALDAVAALRSRHHGQFPRHASDMTEAEYVAAKKRRGITVRRRFT